MANFGNVTDSTNNSDIELKSEGLVLSTFAIITLTLQLTIMIPIIVGNTLVLAAISRFKTLQDITGIFVANLAVADLIIGLSLPFQIAFFLFPSMEKNEIACLLRFEIIIFACNASIYSLFCTVVDRFIAISFPLRYTEIMTTKIAYGLITAIWIFDICSGIIPFMSNNWDVAPICLYELVMDKNFRAFIHIGGTIFALCMLLIYVRIYTIVRKHMRQIQNEASLHARNQVSRQTKQMNTVIAIVVVFFHLSWLPFFTIELTMLELEYVTEEKVLIATFSVFLGLTNSIVNPIIYAWKNKQYRRAFKKLLGLAINSDEMDTVQTTG